MPFRERTTPAVVEMPTTDAEKEKFHRENARRLADYLKQLPRESLWMASWVDHLHDAAPTEHECGTTACAMGWAVLSGVIPGLGWQPWHGPRFVVLGERPMITPVINGKKPMYGAPWAWASTLFFGKDVYSRVFLSGAASRKEVIENLEQFAEHGASALTLGTPQ